jgi:hypothetical protein
MKKASLLRRAALTNIFELLLLICIQTPLNDDNYEGLYRVYGELHVCIVERENPGKTTEKGEE